MDNKDLEELRERISGIIQELLVSEPFFGMLLARSWVIAKNDISSIATDGLKIYINPGYAEKIDNERLTRELLHTLGHIVFKHVPRMKAKNAEPGLWHLASDATLEREMFNDTSVLAKISEIVRESVSELMRMSTEEIYELLINRLQTQAGGKQSQQGQGGQCPLGGQSQRGQAQSRRNNQSGSSGQQNRHGGKGSRSDVGKDKSDSRSGGQSQSNNVGGNGGSGQKDAMQNNGNEGGGQGINEQGSESGDNNASGGQQSEHQGEQGSDGRGSGEQGREGSNNEGSSEGNETGSDGEAGSESKGGFGDAFVSGGSVDDASVVHKGDDEDKDISIEDSPNGIERRVNDKLLEIFNALKMIGNAPGWLQRLVDQIASPKVDWRDVLRATLDKALGREIIKKWSFINRHFPEEKPGKQFYGIDKVAILVDTSGSISDNELRQFVGEVYAVLRSHAVREVIVIPWDAEAYEPIKLTSPGQIKKLKTGLSGGGGTVIKPALELAQKLKVDYIIILSDWDIFDIRDSEVQKLLASFRKVVAVTTDAEPVVPPNAVKLYLPLKQ